MPLGGVPASVAIFALRLVSDTAAAHFLKTASRQRIRSATPVYTRLHPFAPACTDLHHLFKKIFLNREVRDALASPGPSKI